MKSFYFQDLAILSRREKRARRIVFDPRATVLTGKNRTGKSSVMKCLMWVCGGAPFFEEEWRPAKASARVNLVVGGTPATILRDPNEFCVIVDGGAPQRFDSVREASYCLGSLFGFRLTFPNRKDLTSTPAIPSYMLLPFYVDQDKGWSDPWNGFTDLKTFEKWQDGVIEYHANIRGAEFYEARARRDHAKSEIAKIESEKEQVSEIFRHLRVDLQTGSFNRSFDDYRVDLEELLGWCERLRAKEEAYKDEITRYRNSVDSLKIQIAITKHALEEVKGDFDFAAESDEELPCPLCGSVYANTWAERFGIAIDSENCAESLAEMKKKLKKVERDLQSKLSEAVETTTEREKIEQLLAKREGEVQLVDLLREEGRRELKGAMDARIAAFDTNINREVLRSAEEERKMKASEDRQRQDDINAHFRKVMELLSAAVSFSLDDSFRTVRSKFRAGGSETARGLLAYKISFLHLIREFGGIKFFPLLIDSPDQQDQDDESLAKMLRLIRDRRPNDTQLILGATKTMDVDFGGIVHDFGDVRHILSADEFESIEAEFSRYGF